MKKRSFQYGMIIFIIMAITSIVAIILNNKIAYPICFNLNLILMISVIVVMYKDVKTYKTYEIKMLMMHLADLIRGVGIICLIGAPLLLKYFDLFVLSYTLVVVGSLLAIIGHYYEYYLFKYVFKRKEEIVEC